MRILLVEDETALRIQLADHFSSEGMVVEQAADGNEALYMASEFPYDLAIVDIGLPEITGIDLIRRWRNQGLSFPILILTARSNWQDKVEGLEAGADDYVTKPFHPEEVQARVNALLRRAAGHAQAQAHYGPLQINLSAKQVQINGCDIELTSFEYNTLEYLIHKAGAVVSKNELTEHLYDQDFDRDSNVIEVFVGRLRKKLDPKNQFRPIQTVRGAGYRFALDAKTHNDSTE